MDLIILPHEVLETPHFISVLTTISRTLREVAPELTNGIIRARNCNGWTFLCLYIAAFFLVQ